jgi:NtrC-family two-component system sensor histidine kinase KinB
MRWRQLQTRFILAGCLLVLTTVGSSLWSALTFARLSTVVGDSLRQSQQPIDLAAELASSLEREDDALLLALSGDMDRARRELASERHRGDECYRRLEAKLQEGGRVEREIADSLKPEVDAYRSAGTALIADSSKPDALERYHRQVNPLLRRAVASCDQVREENFKRMQEAGIRARDEASRATWVVVLMALVAIGIASVVAIWLLRSVVVPIQDLTASVDDLRQGNFDRRVRWSTEDELGQLAAGFNRMAETLAEYRRSSLGELLAAKTTLEETLNALPDAVIVIAPDGSIAACNPLAEQILTDRDTGPAERLQDLPLQPAHREAIEAALAGRAQVPARTAFGQAFQVQQDGQRRKYLLRALPIPEFAPHRTGAVVVLDDVTDFARLDELRSELIGIASHELKTPLTTLRMNLLLLGEKADNLTPRQQEMLSAALQGCEELGSTIEEVLDVTRIEAGHLRLNLERVDVEAVLAQVLRALQPRFNDAQVRVQVDREGERAFVRGDSARLGIVLTNVLTNALKYSPPGGMVAIQVSSGQNAELAHPPPVRIAVTDVGPGIPEEFRERVFEKFFRVEQHRHNDQNGVRGTGIGLYLCREIVKAHGGSIWCEPGVGGVGTCVRLTLPGLT